jgi:hypothetical protein
MTHRTRYFLVGSGLIVVVGLCTGLVAYYGGNLPLGGGVRGPAELAYVPADTAAVAFADVRHIMDSQFRQRVRAFIPKGEAKDRLLAETGIDVERDVDSVVVGMGGSDANHVALIRGRFQDDRIESLAREHGATIEDYRGKRLVIAPVREADAGDLAVARSNGEAAMAFLESNLLAFGDVDGLKRAIDAASTRENVASNPELMKFVGGVTSGDAWVVGRFDTLAGDARMAPAMRNQLSSLQWFSLSADVDQAILCRIHAEAKNAAAGDELRAVVNGVIAAARMMANKDARMNTVLNSVQSSGAGADIDLSFTVPPDLIDMVATAARAPMGAGRLQ